MLLRIILFLTIWPPLLTKAQDTKVIAAPKSAADCVGAIKIIDQFGPVKNVVGFGATLDMYNPYNDYPFLLFKEFHPVWFKFSAEESGELELIIKSVNPEDDYNFALYPSPGPWFCNTFRNELIGEPVRANRSSSDRGSGRTGISSEGKEERGTAETPSAFCKPFLVNRGDSFYLYVDSDVQEQNGYTIELKIKPPTVNN